MAIGPENAGISREERERIRQLMIDAHEERIDLMLRRWYRPGETLRVPIPGRESESVAEILLGRYCQAGWKHARVQKQSSTECILVLES